MPKSVPTHLTAAAGAAMLALAVPALGDSRPLPAAPVAPSYADLADLADAAQLVVRARPRWSRRVPPAQVRGVKAGWARYLVEAKTEALIYGRGALGTKVSYLVDLPLDARGKPPRIRTSMLLFARPVEGRPAELQLVAPDAQMPWDEGLDARLRSVLAEFNAPGAPQKITGVREAIHVPGDLAGQGETQLFLGTASGEPAAITVIREPAQPPRWSVSFSEVVEASGEPPRRETLGWYRLACFLPRVLPGSVNISSAATDRARAASDYRMVLESLGPCTRNRG
jgi:hypothetical protein